MHLIRLHLSISIQTWILDKRIKKNWYMNIENSLENYHEEQMLIIYNESAITEKDCLKTSKKKFYSQLEW